MAFTLKREDGEELIFHGSLELKKGREPFAFALSSRAVYLPRKKRFAVSDPYYFERVAISQIREVALERMRPYALWALAAVLILVGGITSYWMTQPSHQDAGGTVSVYPFGLIVAGLVIPFVARGRRRLIVTMIDNRFVWKAPLVMDSELRAQAREIQEGIISAFGSLHIPTRVA